MKFIPTAVEDCVVVRMDRHPDDRGYFQELYEEDKYQHGGILDKVEQRWQQVNWSVSKKNVLRGIHCAEYAKLVTCISGRIWDLVVDLRPKSPTFLKHIGVELHPDEPTQVYVPPGCGHGFVSLEDNSNVVYMQSGRYAKQGELTVMYNEPNLKIEWPGENHIISVRDAQASPLWCMLTCLEDETDFALSDKLQRVWVDSLPSEERAEWIKKYPLD
jgi:dTDP-4-dehydrorhamnose 3,5-epimerase